jgi:hypothetical protein
MPFFETRILVSVRSTLVGQANIVGRHVSESLIAQMLTEDCAGMRKFSGGLGFGPSFLIYRDGFRLKARNFALLLAGLAAFKVLALPILRRAGVPTRRPVDIERDGFSVCPLDFPWSRYNDAANDDGQNYEHWRKCRFHTLSSPRCLNSQRINRPETQAMLYGINPITLAGKELAGAFF